MRSTLYVLFTVCLLNFPSLAQNAYLSGLVKDKSDAVIVSASVTLTNVETGSVATGKSNGSGFFAFPSVIPGRYSLSGEAKGFSRTVIDNIKIDTAANVSQDIVLQVGQAEETVTVNSSQPQLAQTTGAVSMVISRPLIENMPLNGKDLQTLFELAPGTVLNAGGSPANGGGFSVNGQRPTSNYLTVDGTSGNAFIPIGSGSNITGASIAVSASGGSNGMLPVDAIEEYRMDTSGYSAEFGRTPGAQIQVKTRGGTNDFHGALFDNFRNQILDATDWFVKHDDLKQTPLRMNDFGGTFGGPILRNRLFFFLAHDTLLLDQPASSTGVDVPTESLRQSADPVFKPFLAAFPNGNAGPDPRRPEYDLFNQSYAYIVEDHTTSARLDADLWKQSRVFFRFNIAPSHTEDQAFNAYRAAVDIYSYTGGVTTPLGTRLLNTFTVNTTRNHTEFTPFTGSTGGNNPSTLQANLPPGVDSSRDYFQFYTGYFSSVSIGPSDKHTLRQWNLLDAISWTVGRHNLTSGVDYLSKNTSLQGYRNYVGLFTATDAPTYTSIENGTTTLLSHQYYSSYPTVSLSNLSLYAEDNWRVSRTLTLNYGLRWEYNPAPSINPLGVLGLTSTSLNPATVTAAVTNKPLYNNKYDNFAPRLGFASVIHDSQEFGTVIRGGGRYLF